MAIPSVKNEKVTVYPNPASSAVYIESPVRVNASLMDINGNIIQNIPNAKTIDIDALPCGVYLLDISNTENVRLQIEKIVKTN